MGFLERMKRGAESSSEPQVDPSESALDVDFIDGILEKARFPLTEHNRAAIYAMMHVMLRTKAYEYIAFDKPEAVADRFVESHPLRGSETSFADLQRVVDDVIAVQPACAPYMRGEHLEAESVLLDVAASGGGMFNMGPLNRFWFTARPSCFTIFFGT